MLFRSARFDGSLEKVVDDHRQGAEVHRGARPATCWPRGPSRRLSLSRALAKTGYFEDLLLDRIAISEQTGNLAPGLRDIARSYRAALDKWLGAVSQTISAAVLTAAFSFVAFIAYAIVSAVFEVSSSFRF